MRKTVKLLAILIVIGIAYYAISPLFNDIEVNDPLPPTLPVEIVNMLESEGGAENLSVEDKLSMENQMKELELEGPKTTNDVMLSFEDSTNKSEIMNTIGHPAEGSVRVLDTQDGKLLRFEDFKTINGPRLHVYLAKDLAAKEFIDLGMIRGTEGNINYEIPDGVDISEYKYVMHWCVPFGVLFNFADISQL